MVRFALTIYPCMVKKNEIKKTEGVGEYPHTKKLVYQKTFLYSVKLLCLEEEKESSLGSEPVNKFLPSARFKLGINLVHDTA